MRRNPRKGRTRPLALFLGAAGAMTLLLHGAWGSDLLTPPAGTTLPTRTLLPPLAAPPNDANGQPLTGLPQSLKTLPVQLPDLTDYVQDKYMATVLGKAFFWDMQAGSDGKQACATCHFHAGTDGRIKSQFGQPKIPSGVVVSVGAVATPADFPFFNLLDPTKQQNTQPLNPDGSPNPNFNPATNNAQIFGSQGTIKENYLRSFPGIAVEQGNVVHDSVFTLMGVNTRQVEPRNTPNVINAVFNDRQFYDGRASRFFNGVTPFGDSDPTAKVWKWDGKKTVSQVSILIDDASLASQAVAPPVNNLEMSYNNRPFADIGKKMLPMCPLAGQQVAADDSLLGYFANTKKGGKGLKPGITYSAMIQKAFKSQWWGGPAPGNKKYTQMEANFSMFWGISIMLYEATLVADNSPFDQFAAGQTISDPTQLAILQGLGPVIGDCLSTCHTGPELTMAGKVAIRGVNGFSDPTGASPTFGPIQSVTLPNLGAGATKYQDTGFLNIGMTPDSQDPGVDNNNGGNTPSFSLAKRASLTGSLSGYTLSPTDAAAVQQSGAVQVTGCLKVPSLRNSELTGPYFHNGGMKNASEILLFYGRGQNFPNPEVASINAVNGAGPADLTNGLVALKLPVSVIEGVVAPGFLNIFTDDRVKFQKAPFDHPELIVPNGPAKSNNRSGAALDTSLDIPAVGAGGSTTALKSFEDTMSSGN